MPETRSRLREAGGEAVRKELSQLLLRELWEPIPSTECLTQTPIPSQIFLRDKRDTLGRLVKVKVAGGHCRSTSSVATEALLTTIGIAATLNHSIAAMDVEAAYLEVDIGQDQEDQRHPFRTLQTGTMVLRLWIMDLWIYRLWITDYERKSNGIS